MTNKTIEADEFELLSNSSKYKIDIFRFSSEETHYIFKRRKDQRLICKFDFNLNLIEDIQCPVLLKDFESALNRLKEYKNDTDWIEDYFS